MKNTYALIRLAKRLSNKYGQAQDLKTIIQNASGFGEKSDNGIMDFTTKLKEQKARMSFDVNVSGKMLGGRGIEVTPPIVTPPQFAPFYSKLPDQIERYLNKHIQGFPQIPDGTTTLEWDFQENTGNLPIAQR